MGFSFRPLTHANAISLQIWRVDSTPRVLLFRFSASVLNHLAHYNTAGNGMYCKPLQLIDLCVYNALFCNDRTRENPCNLLQTKQLTSLLNQITLCCNPWIARLLMSGTIMHSEEMPRLQGLCCSVRSTSGIAHPNPSLGVWQIAVLWFVFFPPSDL